MALWKAAAGTPAVEFYVGGRSLFSPCHSDASPSPVCLHSSLSCP